MIPVKSSPPKGRSPVTQAVEPRCYDRRFYARALLIGAILIMLTTGFAIYSSFYKTATPAHEEKYDIGSLFTMRNATPPDAGNPCIILQEYLETTRASEYARAYGYLFSGLQKSVSLKDFTDNTRSNSLLFREISGYSFPSYRLDAAGACAVGYIQYKDGGRSRVEAAFARENNAWKISEMTVIYE